MIESIWAFLNFKLGMWRTAGLLALINNHVRLRPHNVWMTNKILLRNICHQLKAPIRYGFICKI